MGWPAVALAALAGLFLGSFIAGFSWRWPRGEAFLIARSRCANCNAALSPPELVPVLSYLWLRGRCRHCAAPIPARHLAIELAAALLCALAALTATTPLAALAGALFGLLLLALLVLDAEHFWLPDALTAPLLVAGLLLGPAPLAERLWGAVLGFGGLALIGWGYQRLRGREGLGGGDPKLAAGLGAWLGWPLLPLLMVAASAIGLLLAGLDRARGRPVAADTRLPLGALMALAGWPLWLARPLLLGWMEGG